MTRRRTIHDYWEVEYSNRSGRTIVQYVRADEEAPDWEALRAMAEVAMSAYSDPKIASVTKKVVTR